MADRTQDSSAWPPRMVVCVGAVVLTRARLINSWLDNIPIME